MKVLITSNRRLTRGTKIFVRNPGDYSEYEVWISGYPVCYFGAVEGRKGVGGGANSKPPHHFKSNDTHHH